MQGASIHVHFHGPVNAPVSLKIDAKVADLLDVSDDEGHGCSPPATKVTRRESECGYTIPELRAMDRDERTRVQGGELQGLCSHCTQDWRPLVSAFLPKQAASNTVRRVASLREACIAFQEAWFTGDSDVAEAAYDLAIKTRTDLCVNCQKPLGYMASGDRACYQEYERMKREACAQLGGCPTPGCPEKGTASWICLQADHIDPSTKILPLSAHTRWSGNGGVAAMRQEAEKVRWMCGCCHRLLPTSNAGKSRKEKKLLCRKNEDARVAEKEAYVNAVKLRIGRCQYPDCGRRITAETVRAFDFDHRDPLTKATHKTHPELVYPSDTGGVGALIANKSEHATLEHIKDILDAEVDKCDLLCHNCHMSRKPRGRARWDES